MLKDDFSYAMLFLSLAIFVIWPFLVFFNYIIVGLVILIICGTVGAILYEIYRGLVKAENKITHHKPTD